MIFNQSLTEGVVPADWKLATVCPIFKKKGSKTEPGNYRPVSLTCILCKIMENLVRKQIMNHVESNKLLNPQQHGFVTGKSCTTNLLETLDDWTQEIENDNSVDAIYMDFKKAFDTVPHKRLLLKLDAIGIKGNTQNWIRKFLEGRNQRVVVNGTKSSPADVTSGIPQGSVLGPTLFVIYINDLPLGLKNTAQLFADDTKLYGKSNTKEDQITIQEDLNTLQLWSDKWLLAFHPDKCHTIKLGKTKSEAEYYLMQKNGKKTILQESIIEKDLGVIVDNQLSFQNQISTAVAKANKVLGVIRRSFTTGDKTVFMKLYKSIVRPIIEYGNVVWHPTYKTLEKDIENVQRRATKMLGSIKNLTYPERLKQLNLPSLQHRRRRGDMIETFKYIKGKYTTIKPEWKKNVNQNRGNSCKLMKNRQVKRTRINYLTNRVVSDWNALPENVIQADTINQFKNRLDKHWEKLETIHDPSCQ